MYEITYVLQKIIDAGGKAGLAFVCALALVWVLTKVGVILVQAWAEHRRQEREARERERQSLLAEVAAARTQLEDLTKNHMAHLEASNARAVEFQGKAIAVLTELAQQIEAGFRKLDEHAVKSEKDHDRIIDRIDLAGGAGAA